MAAPDGLGMSPSPSVATIARWLHCSLITLKRAYRLPYPRNTERVKQLRKEFALWYLRLGDAQRRVVHIDEHGVNLWCKRSRARAPIGQRAHIAIPSQKGINVMTVGAVSPERGAFFGQAIPGGINTERFKKFMVDLIEEWEKGSDEGMIAIIDNVNSHSDSMLMELMENTRHSHKFLPPWSPFLNPIEEVFGEHKSKMKKLLAERRSEVIAIDNYPRGTKTADRLNTTASVCRDAFQQLSPVVPYYRHMEAYFARCVNLEDIQS